ncbi:cation:proton antiporter [Candidatus Woesearchaeota archaeon]|nr:cation:proton antiporter [Candidatus Woesearchaeota archaeon]
MADLFLELGLVILAAALFAYAAYLRKQPVILGYLLAGLVLGPAGFGIVSDTEAISTLSEIGIAFLLFMVGLELDTRRLKGIGKPALIAGLAQVAVTFIVGYALSRFLGLQQIPSFYVSLGLTLSSTVLVVKMLSDRNEINTLHAQLAIGILLVQDLIAMVALAILPNLGAMALSTFSPLLWTLLAGVVLVSLAMVAGRMLLEPVFRQFARSSELLFLASISWLFLLGLLANALNFSVSIGAFIAGVSLAPLAYRPAIIAGTRSLRNFFATIFFVTIGMQVTMAGILSYWPTMLALTFFVVIGNPIIVFLVLVMFGFTSRISLLSGLAVAQVSEFSLILVLEGARLGHIPRDMVSLIAIVLLLSFTASTYLILHGSKIYLGLAGFLKPFERFAPRPRVLGYLPERAMAPEAVLIGCNRMGFTALRALRSLRKRTVVVDSNPDIIKKLSEEKVPCVYGDISDPALAEMVGIRRAQIVVSTLPGIEENRLLVSLFRRKHPILILTAAQADEALELYEKGADYVVLPHYLGGHHLAMLLHESSRDMGKLLKQKVAHLEELKLRLKPRRRHG